MKIVLQTNHETCQHACIAMLAGVSIEAVIELVGDRALDATARRRAFDHFGITYPAGEAGSVVGIVETPLVKLMRDHRTLLCSVADWKDPSWGHAVLIYDQHLYDPWRGIDPEWPWTRHVWKAMQIDGPATK
jgi:hypothetical protein